VGIKYCRGEDKYVQKFNWKIERKWSFRRPKRHKDLKHLLDVGGSGYIPLTGLHNHSIESQGSIKGSKYLDQWRDFHVLQNHLAAWG
jgi:hypothetical protein